MRVLVVEQTGRSCHCPIQFPTPARRFNSTSTDSAACTFTSAATHAGRTSRIRFG